MIYAVVRPQFLLWRSLPCVCVCVFTFGMTEKLWLLSVVADFACSF